MEGSIIRWSEGGTIPLLIGDQFPETMRLSIGKNLGLEPEKVRSYPLRPESLDAVGGDLVVIGLYGSRRLYDVLEKFRFQVDSEIPPGGYLITKHFRGNRGLLVVIGGDLAAAFYAINHLGRFSEAIPTGIRYTGGTVKEFPAFRHRIYWTWDHSTNWALEYPGQLDWGCGNAYCKPSEAFLKDYKLLMDYMLLSRASGLLIWGFLRDSHGGISAGRELCRYAKDLGLKLMPSIGTSEYGGFYYEGDHIYNTAKWLRLHPDFRVVDQDGRRRDRLCPSHPRNIEWIRNGVRWLFETFDTDSANLEYGDFAVCYCDRCKETREKLGGNDPDYYKDMVTSHVPFIEEAFKINPSAEVMYATYSGFKPGENRREFGYPGDPPPYFVRHLSENSICMWTLTHVLRRNPAQHLEWMDEGLSIAFWDNPDWPEQLSPPTRHSVGFVHQGSQWYSRGGKETRHSVEISSIKEACLRAYRSGMEGICIHGEVSRSCVPYELNYLAFSHFCYHPEDSLRDFARAQLSGLVGDEELAQIYVEILAKHERGILDDNDRKKLNDIDVDFRIDVLKGKNFDAYRRWRWLNEKCNGPTGEEYMIFP